MWALLQIQVERDLPAGDAITQGGHRNTAGLSLPRVSRPGPIPREPPVGHAERLEHVPGDLDLGLRLAVVPEPLREGPEPE